MHSKVGLRLVMLAVVALVSAGCEALGARKADYHPAINPANFQAKVDNPYYPLVPGTTFTYVEKTRFETSENTITVTHDTKRVMGIDCTVVHDVVTTDGHVAEDTYDWLAQDKDGTVWYFGEDTREISPGGQVSTLGSWEAGIDGAQPGILMPARPTPGEPYRQEYLAGIAEDMGQVAVLGESVTVPAGTFTDTVKTTDWSMLEAGNEYKWYARGVGVVREMSSSGEVVTLTSIARE